jgi:hypothetical protein
MRTSHMVPCGFLLALGACAQTIEVRNHKPESVTDPDQITDPGVFAANRKTGTDRATYFTATDHSTAGQGKQYLHAFHHYATTTSQRVELRHAKPLPGNPVSMAVGSGSDEPVMAIGRSLVTWRKDAYVDLASLDNTKEAVMLAVLGGQTALLGIATNEQGKLDLLTIDPTKGYEVAATLDLPSLLASTAQLVESAGDWRMGFLAGPASETRLVTWSKGKTPTDVEAAGMKHLLLSANGLFVAGDSEVIFWDDSGKHELAFPTNSSPAVHGMVELAPPGANSGKQLWVLASIDIAGTRTTCLLKRTKSQLEIDQKFPSANAGPTSPPPRCFAALDGALSFVSGRGSCWSVLGSHIHEGEQVTNADTQYEVNSGFADGCYFLFADKLTLASKPKHSIVLCFWTCL